MTITIDAGAGSIQAKGYTLDGETLYHTSGWVPLTTETISSSVASVEIDVTGYTAYEELMLVWEGVTHVTDNTNLFLKMSDDNGSTFSSSHDGHLRFARGATSALVELWSATRTGIVLAAEVGNAAGESSFGKCVIVNWQDGTNDQCFFTESTVGQYQGSWCFNWMVGAKNVGGTTTDLQIIAAAGNIDGGELVLYGRTHA